MYAWPFGHSDLDLSRVGQNDLRQECEGICGLWFMINEKNCAENMNKIVGVVLEL